MKPTPAEEARYASTRDAILEDFSTTRAGCYLLGVFETMYRREFDRLPARQTVERVAQARTMAEGVETCKRLLEAAVKRYGGKPSNAQGS